MTIENNPAKGIWRHKCVMNICNNHIIYDDEPYCFEHSLSSGSSVSGYSAYTEYLQTRELNENGVPVDWEHHPHNV